MRLLVEVEIEVDILFILKTLKIYFECINYIFA